MRTHSERKNRFMNNRLQSEGWPSRCTPGMGDFPPCAAQHRQRVPQSWSDEGVSLLSPSPYRSAFTGPTVSAPSAPYILVIDDSMTVRKILETCHRRNGFSVETFADGLKAFQWVSAHPTTLPSLVYLDIEMPLMDGYDVARALHARPGFAQVPILMLSGRDGLLDRVKGRLAGAKGYITKPFRGEDILAQTRSYLSPVQPTSRG